MPRLFLKRLQEHHQGPPAKGGYKDVWNPEIFPSQHFFIKIWFKKNVAKKREKDAKNRELMRNAEYHES